MFKTGRKLWLDLQFDRCTQSCIWFHCCLYNYIIIYLALLLEHVAEGYRAMDERRAIKALLIP